MAAVRPDGALLDELLTLAPVGLALLDERRCYLWINNELARINGAPAEAHIGRPVAEMVPHLAGGLEPHHQRASKRREVVRNVEISRDPSRGPHWLASYYPVGIGRLRAVAVIVHEVTDRRRAEEALSEAQRLARIGSWEWTAVDGDMTWSPELARILGHSPSEVRPSLATFLAAVHPGDVERVRQAMRGGLERRERFELELRVLPPGGPERVVNAIGTPALDEQGRLVSYLGTVQDVTERAHSEAAVAELAAARGRLAAQILDAEEQTRRRISEVLHDHSLQSAVAEHRGRRGGFDCRVEVDPDVAGVHDALLVSLARELLTNVAKHARAAHATVAVRREREWIVLEVADDGCGAESGRPEAALHEGHIGLAALARRVEAIGGRFEFASRPGRGVRVRAALPAF